MHDNICLGATHDGHPSQ